MIVCPLLGVQARGGYSLLIVDFCHSSWVLVFIVLCLDVIISYSVPDQHAVRPTNSLGSLKLFRTLALSCVNFNWEKLNLV